MQLRIKHAIETKFPDVFVLACRFRVNGSGTHLYIQFTGPRSREEIREYILESSEIDHLTCIKFPE